MSGALKRCIGAFLAAGVQALAPDSVFASPQEDPVSIAWVQARVDNGQIRSIEQLLELLPSSYRSQFTLISESQSRQAATLQEPRVIFFGPQSSFLLAVNGGGKNVPGANVAEMIQFNSIERKFEFFELEERAGREGQGGSVTLKRGVGCTDCHRSDPRPNWQPYHQWPGAFGGYDDSLTPEELKAIADLKANAAAHPRYSSLFGLEQRYLDHPYRQLSMPNIHFTQRLAQLNFQRIARLIQATPGYDKFKYSILGTLVCSKTDPNRFLPPEHKAADLNEVSGDPGVRGRSAFLRLFEKRGIDTRDWTMAFLPASQAFAREGTGFEYDEFQTPGLAHAELTGAIVSLDFDLQKYAKVRRPHYQETPTFLVESTDTDCKALAQAADEALSGGRHRAVSAPGWIKTCMACHDGNMGAIPELPLDRPMALKAKLAAKPRLKAEIFRRTAEGAARDESMPPGVPLTDTQREELKRYIDTLGE